MEPSASFFGKEAINTAKILEKLESSIKDMEQ